MPSMPVRRSGHSTSGPTKVTNSAMASVMYEYESG